MVGKTELKKAYGSLDAVERDTISAWRRGSRHLQRRSARA